MIDGRVLERLPYGSWSRVLYLVGSRVGLGIVAGLLLSLLPMPWFAVGLVVFGLVFFVFTVRTQLWFNRTRHELDEILADLEGRRP